MKELFYVPFYILYLLNYIYNLFVYMDQHEAYRNIYFEKEAHEHQYDLNYIKYRKKYNYFGD